MKAVLNSIFKIKFGKLIKIFVLSDLLLLGGWGLTEPIFALFIVEKIGGATIVTVGIAASVYWLTKAVVQVPVATMLDRMGGERDDFVALIFALLTVGVVALLYVFIDKIWQLYALQILQAVAFGVYQPSWSGMFSRHLDKNHEALDWSLDNAAISISAGISGLVSGILVASFGYSMVFVITSIFSFMAAFIIFSAPDIVFSRKKSTKKHKIRNHKPLVNTRR